MVRLRKVKASTNARKFDAHGDWFYFTRIPQVFWRALRNRGAIGAGKVTTEAREAPFNETDMNCDIAFDLAVADRNR